MLIKQSTKTMNWKLNGSKVDNLLKFYLSDASVPVQTSPKVGTQCDDTARAIINRNEIALLRMHWYVRHVTNRLVKEFQRRESKSSLRNEWRHETPPTTLLSVVASLSIFLGEIQHATQSSLLSSFFFTANDWVRGVQSIASVQRIRTSLVLSSFSLSILYR